jgi:SAM-dependent methyltransferase
MHEVFFSGSDLKPWAIQLSHSGFSVQYSLTGDRLLYTDEIMNHRNTCLVCGSSRLLPVIRLDRLPACCNFLPSARSDALDRPTAMMSLTLCRQCGHLFNAEFDSRLVRYEDGYENSLRGSERFREYDAKLAEDLIERNRLHGRTVVEVGCGRGEFLRILCDRGNNRGLGFDPSYPGDGSEYSHALDSEYPHALDIEVLSERYEDQPRDLEVDLVCSRQTLEHVEDPQGFLRSIARSTQSHVTPVFVEVPNGLFTLRDAGIWDLIHEHCSYFTPQSLKRVFELSCYRSIEVTETFGGQFLTVHAETGCTECTTMGAEIDYLEELVGKFALAFWNTIERWNRKLKELDERKQKVVVWGGGSKGITFLNILRPHNIHFIVDVNTMKHSKYIPGTGQQIVPPKFLSEYKPDVIIIMNSNYREEIMRHVSTLGLNAEFLFA